MKIALIDERMNSDARRALEIRGFRLIDMPKSRYLGDGVASHPDMLIARVAGEFVTTADYCEYAGIAISEIFDETRARFHFTSDVHGNTYPSDVIFNSLVLGDKLFARLDSLSTYLKELATAKGLRLVNVRQGYPACTTLRLSDEAVITADDGMERALVAEGIRVYKIEEGGILLPPYEHGFIGGCASVYEGAVYFIGDPSTHPSYSTIKKAIEAEGLRPISLGGGALFDLGGIIFAERDIDQHDCQGYCQNTNESKQRIT